MSKFLSAVLGPFGLRKTGFERIGQNENEASNLEMNVIETYATHDDAEDTPDKDTFDFFCLTEFTDVASFPAFDYDTEQQYFRRHSKLCYIADKNVVAYAMKQVANHLHDYGLGNFGVSADIKACEIDANVLIQQSTLPPADYPITLSGRVPESALCVIIARDDSDFFRRVKKELRRRKCYGADWEKIGVYRIPATLAAYVCMKGTDLFLGDANDTFTVDDVANYCVNEEKRARQAKKEAVLRRQRKMSSRSKKKILLDDSDTDSEEYEEIRDHVHEQYTVESIVRLGAHRRWYRLPFWALEFADSYTKEDDSVSAASSPTPKSTRDKKDPPASRAPDSIL